MERKNNVTIDFVTSYNTKLPCIKVDSTRVGDIYMVIIPGTILGIIFEQYKEALFENNTNTFYQFKRKGNIIDKEIRKTLRQNPELFFSCNNGLSTIASEIETIVIGGMLYISRINNWQIINGATTTAAIAASLTNKKIDLNKVFVPLKICVTHLLEQDGSVLHEIFFSTNRQSGIPNPDISFSCCGEVVVAKEENPIPISDLALEVIPWPQIEKVESCKPDLWFELSSWAKDQPHFTLTECKEAFAFGAMKTRKGHISYKQALRASKILEKAELFGFESSQEELSCQTYCPKVDHAKTPGVSQDIQMSDVNDYCDVYSSVYSPAEVKRKTNMLVQVYLHLQEEAEKVLTLSQEAQKNAERRDYIPLQCKLKRGDKVDISLNIYGETLLQSEKKSVIWFGTFTKCTFSYFVPKDIEVDELRCVAILSVNGAQIGEMCFVTEIVETPRSLHPEVFTRKYKKIFISYAHQDESKVKFIAQAYKAQGVDYFFDRDYLKAGDIFPQKIENYINSADLFILCWSKNAAQSDYVKKERNQALDRAYPKVKPIEKAPLSIYPLSIEPREELPEDMRDTYNFELV